jgi:hypothetical protein
VTRHLAERADGVGEVLEHLVGVDDVEGRGGIRKRHDVCQLEPRSGVTACGGVAAGLGERPRDVLDADDLTRGAHRLGKVQRDGARAPSDVEHAQPLAQVGQQVRRRVRGRTRPV